MTLLGCVGHGPLHHSRNIYPTLLLKSQRRREPEECEHSGNGICEEEEEEEEEEGLLCSIVLKRKQHSISKHRAPDPLL
ncbi:hypothetical protein QQF64_002229 [Cirrhinus molitorella]|uniref:Uncharacterized protein n=1 Tax=Cirrhinus molitorella TaxID=172907 RepID=A0ABR3MPK2_9TELE